LRSRLLPFLFYGRYGRVIDSWSYSDWPVNRDEIIERGWHSCSVLVPHNGLIRTSFIRDNNLKWSHFEYGWGCDVLFTILAIQSNPKLKLINSVGFNWRTHGNNNSCDVERRVKLVLAVKEYYLENIPVNLYLKHEILDKLSEGSDEYNAACDFLVAADLYNARMNFRVPTMFESEKTAQEVENNLFLFDEEIRNYYFT